MSKSSRIRRALTLGAVVPLTALTLVACAGGGGESRDREREREPRATQTTEETGSTESGDGGGAVPFPFPGAGGDGGGAGSGDSGTGGGSGDSGNSGSSGPSSGGSGTVVKAGDVDLSGLEWSVVCWDDPGEETLMASELGTPATDETSGSVWMFAEDGEPQTVWIYEPKADEPVAYWSEWSGEGSITYSIKDGIFEVSGTGTDSMFSSDGNAVDFEIRMECDTVY